MRDKAMNRYIKLKDIRDAIVDLNGKVFLRRSTLVPVLKAIGDLPTIDIVNCIECAYLGEDWWCYKHEFTPIPIEDYFCKDGERTEE